MTQPPLSIVWHWPADVKAYTHAGRDVGAPEIGCPDCRVALSWWGGYWRWARCGQAMRIWIHRGRCGNCGRTHALLPDFLLVKRLDTVEVIGAGLERGIAGRGMRKVAAEAEVPESTARDWRYRYRARAEDLLAVFGALAVELGDGLKELPTTAEAAALTALTVAWERAKARWPGRVGGCWRFVSAVCGGRALSPNTIPYLDGITRVGLHERSP